MGLRMRVIKMKPLIDITLEQDALNNLEHFLKIRIEKAKTEKVSDKTVSDIFDEVLVDSK